MASKRPGGYLVSFGGTSVVPLIVPVGQVSFPTITVTPVEAYDQLLGQQEAVDLLNGTAAPRKSIFTCNVLVRAADSVTDPVAAWQAVMAAYRALDGLPEVGNLVVASDASGSSTVSCSARRKPLDLTLTAKNVRSITVAMTFTLLSSWA